VVSRQCTGKHSATGDRYRSLQEFSRSALDQSPLDGTRAEDEINEYVKAFEHATDKLKDRAEDREYSPNLAREVLVRGRAINSFMKAHPLQSEAEVDWSRVRNDLTVLANGYQIRWRW
jgi:hypothetical protein